MHGVQMRNSNAKLSKLEPTFHYFSTYTLHPSIPHGEQKCNWIVQILNYKIHKRFLQNNKNPLKTEFHL